MVSVHVIYGMHLGGLAVDDGRQAEDRSLGVVDDWVHKRIANDGDEAPKVPQVLF